MKDFLTRIVVGAIVSAIISAGLLFFAFDQSLRGVETALQSQSDAIAESNQWIRSVDGKVQSAEQKILDRFETLNQKLDQVFEQQRLNGQRQDRKVYAVAADLVNMQTSLSTSLENVHSIAVAMRQTVDKGDPNYNLIVTLVDRLEETNVNFRDFKIRSSELIFESAIAPYSLSSQPSEQKE